MASVADGALATGVMIVIRMLVVGAVCTAGQPISSPTICWVIRATSSLVALIVVGNILKRANIQLLDVEMHSFSLVDVADRDIMLELAIMTIINLAGWLNNSCVSAAGVADASLGRDKIFGISGSAGILTVSMV